MFALLSGAPQLAVRASATGKGSAHLYLYDEISWWGVMASDFVAALADAGPGDVTLHVNSPGGDVFEGIAMLNTLRAHPGNVTAVVEGIAASAASFVLMGADHVLMAPNSELMIHDAWGMCVGDSADMTSMAASLERVSANIASIYQGKAGGDAEQWRSAMLAETWYSAGGAVTAGLADAVRGAAEAPDGPDEEPDSDEPMMPGMAAYDLSQFRNRTQPRPTTTEPATPTSTTRAPQATDTPADIPPLDILSALRDALREAA